MEARKSPLLLLDGSFATGYMALGAHGKLSAFFATQAQNELAAVIQPRIVELLENASTKLHELSAVAVINGPGSYTGLRVALSAAKGICFATGLPLITISTLRVMAAAIQKTASRKDLPILPMIDARRMEVFTALYSSDLQPIRPEGPAIVNDEFLESLPPLFLTGGNGSDKLQNIALDGEAYIQTAYPADIYLESALDLAIDNLLNQQFADLASAEPWYRKGFHHIN